MTTDPKTRLIYEALRFAGWAAGEGLMPADSEPAEAPEDFLFRYSCETGDEDWETIPERLAASKAALAAAHADGMREGMQRAAEIARCDCCDVCGESPGHPKCANEIAAAILAEIEGGKP